MAADAAGVDTTSWNPVATRLEPDSKAGELYEQLYRLYLDSYPANADTMHGLAALDGRSRR
jgi:xylulokinase